MSKWYWCPMCDYETTVTNICRHCSKMPLLEEDTRTAYYCDSCKTVHNGVAHLSLWMIEVKGEGIHIPVSPWDVRNALEDLHRTRRRIQEQKLSENDFGVKEVKATIQILEKMANKEIMEDTLSMSDFDD